MITLVFILLLLWIIGALGHIGGGLIHLILVVILLAVLYRVLTDRSV